MKKHRKFQIFLWLYTTSFFFAPANAQPQQADIVSGDEALPSGSGISAQQEGQEYQSWSLFLVNNPQWLIPQERESLEELYHAFKAFGDAIGPEHSAVWFTQEHGAPEDIWANVDALRAAAVCTALQLPPSKGPYMVFTSEYPGPALLIDYPEGFPSELEDMQVYEFHESSPEQIRQLLLELADQIVLNGIAEVPPTSEEYDRRWAEAIRGTKSFLLQIKSDIKLSIKTGFMDIEIAP